MMEEIGTVVAIRGEIAEVETQRRSACGRCSADGTCGTSLIARYFGNRRLLVQARNAIGAEPGDQVVIGMPDAALLKAAFLAYLVPLLAMIAGAVAGAGIAGAIHPAYEQPLSILGGVGGLAAALFWLSRRTRSEYAMEHAQPQILRRSLLSSHVQRARLQTPGLPGRHDSGASF